MTSHQGQNRPNWKKWRSFFASRQNRLLPNPFLAEAQLSGVPASVARSLAIFQLGESGGGTIVRQVRESTIDAIDEDYASAMEMFVEEEHYHAELLACAVRMLGGELVRDNWTARLFVFGRRLIGLRVKVSVLLVAEVVGVCYYHLLASRLPASELRDVLTSLVEDEMSHLDFHCSFLRSQTQGYWRGSVFRLGWRALSVVSSLVVLIDHRSALKDLGIPARSAWRLWMKVSRHAESLATCKLDRPKTEASATPG